MFCFSTSDNCTGDGIQLSSLEISEVNTVGERGAVMWLIQGKSDRQEDFVIRKLIYGAVPAGWIEINPPSALKAGVFYGVQGEYYFSHAPDGDVNILQREDFFRQIARKSR